MPRRNNRESIFARLAAVPTFPLPTREKTPGHPEWGIVRELSRVKPVAPKCHFYDKESGKETDEYRGQYVPRRTDITPEYLTSLSAVDDINERVYALGWQYIEGGPCDGKWVNPAYPEKVFEGGSWVPYIETPQRRTSQRSCGYALIGLQRDRTRVLPAGVPESRAMADFPIASHEEDPLGLAFHIGLRPNDHSKVVRSNEWHSVDETRKGRKHAQYLERQTRRRARKEQFVAAHSLSGPSYHAKIAELRNRFAEEDFARLMELERAQ